jgi:hypothetical protein
MQTSCELRVNGTDFIGGGDDTRVRFGMAMIPVNGGVLVSTSFAFVGLWCKIIAGTIPVPAHGELVAMQVGGFQ